MPGVTLQGQSSSRVSEGVPPGDSYNYSRKQVNGPLPIFFLGDTSDQLVYVDWKCQNSEVVNPKLS